ncbi:hypothetical protein [Dactylosporangium salmoneum]|uniref:Protein kinase domain-containing protein n=1 Tax=Dactylosporangium salmoneum TaxID=53361 RepID=A0ABN3I463_9ACTN
MELEGRYRLERVIGIGATAEIWRGHDMLLERPVAVRLPRPGRHGRPEGFLAAGRMAARLTHPNVTAIYDVGVTDLPERGAVPFVVMELAEGPLLSARLDARAMTWRQAARIGAEVAAALCAAHGQWVGHGHLGPDKVLLTDVGAKVIGFGGSLSDDFDVAAHDVRALGAILTAGLAADFGSAPAALLALADRCANTESATLPDSAAVAAELALLANLAAEVPADAPSRAGAPARGRHGRTRSQWTVRVAVQMAAVAVLLLGGVAALGQTRPWFGHPPDVAAVPSNDDPCADAALDPGSCLPATAPTQPRPTTVPSRPRPTPSASTPAAGHHTAVAGVKPSTSKSPAASATPSPSDSPSPPPSTTPSDPAPSDPATSEPAPSDPATSDPAATGSAATGSAEVL